MRAKWGGRSPGGRNRELRDNQRRIAFVSAKFWAENFGDVGGRGTREHFVFRLVMQARMIMIILFM